MLAKVAGGPIGWLMLFVDVTMFALDTNRSIQMGRKYNYSIDNSLLMIDFGCDSKEDWFE